MTTSWRHDLKAVDETRDMKGRGREEGGTDTGAQGKHPARADTTTRARFRICNQTNCSMDKKLTKILLIMYNMKLFNPPSRNFNTLSVFIYFSFRSVNGEAQI